MNSKKVINNLTYTLLSNIVTIALGLVVPRLVLVGYGSEVNGLLNSVTQFIVYLGLFEAGVQMVAKQSLYKPVKLDDRDAINAILSAVHVNYKKTGELYFVSLIIMSLIYPFLIKGSTLSYGVIFCVFLFSGLGNVVVFFYHGKYSVLLQVEGKNYILANIQTIISVLNSIVKIILLQLGLNVAVIISVSFVVSLIQVVYISLYIKRHYPWIDLRVEPNHAALSQKGSGLIHQIAGLVFQNTDVLILSTFCGLKVVSMYSIYKMITSHLDTLLRIFVHSGDFALGQLYNTDKANYEKVMDMVEVYYSGLAFSVYTVAYVLLIPFITIYTKGISDFRYADSAVSLLFVMVGLLTHSRAMMLNTINYAGHFENTLPQTIVETCINLLVSLIAVNLCGIYGVLIGTVAALLYRDVDVMLYSNHKLLDRSAKKTFAIYLLDVILFITLVFVIKLFMWEIANYVDFVIHGIVLTIGVTTIYMTTLSVFFKNEYCAMKSLICSRLKKKHHP